MPADKKFLHLFIFLFFFFSGEERGPVWGLGGSLLPAAEGEAPEPHALPAGGGGRWGNKYLLYKKRRGVCSVGQGRHPIWVTSGVRLLLFSCVVVSDSCDPMDCSPLGSSVHEISQARILEWVAISFSRNFYILWWVGIRFQNTLTVLILKTTIKQNSNDYLLLMLIMS